MTRITSKSFFKTESPVRFRLRLYLVPAGQEDNGADKSRYSLLEWMRLKAKNARQMALGAGRGQAGNAKSYMSALKHLEDYINSIGSRRVVWLQDVDKDFCRGFAQYLGQAKNRVGGKLSSNSRFLYFSKFSAALNAAVRAGLIPSNPAALLDKSERPLFRQTERSFLTEEEVQMLINTPNTHSSGDVARAFLFSCFCGLRWSDISCLVWGDIRSRGTGLQIEKRMVKTREMLYLPLSSEAAYFLPEKTSKEPSDLVFSLRSYASASIALKKWLSDAGILKPVTFHTARHTFATLLLTQKQDLYTVSKLLGHKSIKVTQIYAEVVDRKKRDAVNSLSGLFCLTGHYLRQDR